MTRPSILIVDNFDSFTFTLADYLKSAGADVTVTRNDEIAVETILGSAIDAFLISPGPGEPEQAGVSIALAAACIEHRRPLLGVCLGHQAIARACGLEIERAAPVHGKTVAVGHDGRGVFEGLPSPFAATRYNSLAVAEPAPALPPPLLVNARSEEGMIMGIRHSAAPVHGVQFHPESIGSEYGHALLGNFLTLATGYSVPA